MVSWLFLWLIPPGLLGITITHSRNISQPTSISGRASVNFVGSYTSYFDQQMMVLGIDFPHDSITSSHGTFP
jgi:hypothetical protein